MNALLPVSWNLVLFSPMSLGVREHQSTLLNCFNVTHLYDKLFLSLLPAYMKIFSTSF